MKTMEIQSYGGIDVLQPADRPQPTAAPGQVVVRVRAATVNPVDVFIRSGVAASLYAKKPPLVLGWDLAGEVVEAGAGVAGFAVGQAVAGMIPWFVADEGAYAEQVAVDAAWLAALPAGLDAVAAATIPLNALTADQALAVLDVQPGQTLLVTGASGGVGGFAAELAARRGVTVLALASTDDEDFVGSLGVAQALPRGTDLGALGVDAVLDAIGLGATALAAARDGGRFAAVVPPSAPAAERGVTVSVINVKADGAHLAELLAAGLTTRVAEVLPLADAAKAHQLLEAGGLRGKVVLTM